MVEGPEQFTFDEPEPLKGFLGRTYLPPPEKVSHFKNRRIDELYEVKRAHLIVNPFSGKKKGDDVGRFVSEELSASKIIVKTYRTEGPEAAIPIVQDLALESGDIIVIVGGDGTFCEVITGFLSRSD